MSRYTNPPWTYYVPVVLVYICTVYIGQNVTAEGLKLEDRMVDIGAIGLLEGAALESGVSSLTTFGVCARPPTGFPALSVLRMASFDTTVHFLRRCCKIFPGVSP